MFTASKTRNKSEPGAATDLAGVVVELGIAQSMSSISLSKTALNGDFAADLGELGCTTATFKSTRLGTSHLYTSTQRLWQELRTFGLSGKSW
jgi:hypothetical protein